MKIAIVCFNLDLQSGGTRQILALAQALQDIGHKVAIYAPQTNPNTFPELSAGLDIRVVPPSHVIKWNEKPRGLLNKIATKLSADALLTEVARGIASRMEGDFKVVNCHDFSYRTGYFYKKLHPQAKVVWTMNEAPYGYLPKETFFQDLASRLYNFWKEISERKFLKAPDVVTTLSVWEAKWAENRGLRAVVMRSGLDFNRFYSSVKPRQSGSKRVELLTIGNPNKYRRYEDAIRALAILCGDGYDARLLVLAKNVWQEDEYCAFLERTAKAEGVKDLVTFYFEGVSESELKKLYATSDVFVHTIHAPAPRNGSAWGLVVFEAMASGLPVVTVRTAGAAEILTDGVNALFVDPASPGQIAEKVKRLIDDSGFYNRLAKSGQEFVKENVSWDHCMQRFLKLFQEV